MSQTRIHPLERLLLLRPERVQAHLDRIGASEVAAPHVAAMGGTMPNLWQVSQGVLRMVHRIIFRFNSIGLSRDNPVRTNLRARLLRFRPLRAPFLFAANALHPLDLSGLLSKPSDIADHLVGTHHDRHQFAYDLQILRALAPEVLTAVRNRAQAVVDRKSLKSGIYRDIVTYEHYHEALIASVDAAMAGMDLLTDAEARDPDVSFWAWLGWCKSQPPTPGATWAAWRAGAWRPDTGASTA